MCFNKARCVVWAGDGVQMPLIRTAGQLPSLRVSIYTH